MKAKEVVLSIAIALRFCFQIIFPVATAHTGGIFTIIVSENGVVPGNVQMLVNDTARRINVDDTENTTHRILVDANSDGIYDGEEDWDSGNLTDSCDYHNQFFQLNHRKHLQPCFSYFPLLSYLNILKIYYTSQVFF